MKKYKDIKELILFLKEEKSELEARIIALESSPLSFEEEVIFKYIETRSTIKAAAFVKEKGIRSPKDTVYAGSDVSALIKENNKNINNVLLRIARDIFDKNTKAVNRAYN